uniref:Uncharacterized protein n=1 Tax=Lactuca sativa TaxID=4236 RepID=A0A9R1WS77_LACSA|nr:hypothetical protein LSAT_V11C900495150 [Lactuca sativa]
MEHSSLPKEIPSIFHLYITHIKNVMGDGNYDFRSVVVCLGYDENEWIFICQELYDELLTSYEDYYGVFVGCDGVLDSLYFFMTDKTTPPEHYMLMPEIGILKANRSKRVSKSSCPYIFTCIHQSLCDSTIIRRVLNASYFSIMDLPQRPVRNRMTNYV